MLSIILAMLLLATLFAGCAGNTAPANSDTPATTDTAQTVTDTVTEAVENGAAADGEVIKIGVLVPLTGAFASLGVDGMEGTKMAFEEIDYKIAGKQVELFFEDTAADPDLCIQKTSRLVEREGVDIILGPLSGGEATALKDYAPNIPNTTIIVAGAAS